MYKIPWKGIAIGSGILTVLVAFRCLITARRFVYYGGAYWQGQVMADPWFYIGMMAAALCVAALLILSDLTDKYGKEKEDTDGCGD